MADEDSPGPLEALDKRLRDAQARSGRSEGGSPDTPDDGKPRFGGLGFAWRIGAELVAGLIVGVGIGLLIDHWLGTGPWGMMAMTVFGFAAGLLNVYRAATGIQGPVGMRKPDGQ